MIGPAAHLDNEIGFELLGNERLTERRKPMRRQLTRNRTVLCNVTCLLQVENKIDAVFFIAPSTSFIISIGIETIW